MNEDSINNWYQSETAPFLPNDIQRPPRNAPSDSKGVVMVLACEYYLDAHRNEIICHQVWKSPDECKVMILTNQGVGWIVSGGSDEYTTFTESEARRCWNHSVDNGATRVYKRANASKSSKYGMTGGFEQWKSSSSYYKYDEDPKSYKELAIEDAIWEYTKND